jgi:hypothetical protein
MLIRRLRRRAACVLWAERLLGAFAVSGMILVAYLVLAVFGLASGWVFLGALLLALADLAWEAARLRPPDAAEIDRRIETASGLTHRPLAALEDVPATAGALGAEIWRRHQARMAAALGGARAGWPAPFAATRDPFALRGLLLLLLASGVLLAGPAGMERMVTAFVLPAWPFPPPEIEAWVTPPAYTGAAPEPLGNGPLNVLLGSGVSVVESGADGAIRYNGRYLSESALGQDSRRADTVIRGPGTLTVGPWWHRLAQWRVNAEPPVAPQVALDQAGPGSDPGTLALSWNAHDPYGLTSLTVALQPAGYDGALPQAADLPAVLGPNRALLDVSDSPFAGMTVTVRLNAANLAGMTARSEPLAVELPPPDLHDPTAVRLSVLRRNLALIPARASAISSQMLKLAEAPPSAIGYGTDAKMAMLATALALRSTTPASAVARMQTLIQEIEAGPDYQPSRQLAQASQALLQALAKGPPDAATLNRLMAAIQQALAEHLRALGAAPENGAPQRSLDASALTRLAQQIAADEQAGRTAQAQAELQELAQALRELQHARPMTPAQAARAQAEEAAAQGLSQLIQSQASLLDQTEQGSANPSQQAQLLSTLNQLSTQLGKAGMPHLPGLQGAEQNMLDAQNALSGQDTGRAQGAETAAIQNLQTAAAALQKAGQQEFSAGGGGGGEIPEGDSPDGTSDDFSLHDLSLPGQNPADTVEQEIIREDSEPALPPATHEYLHRLLAPEQ